MDLNFELNNDNKEDSFIVKQIIDNEQHLELISMYALPKRKKKMKNLLNLLKKDTIDTIQKIIFVTKDKQKVNKKYGINIDFNIHLDLDTIIKKNILNISEPYLLYDNNNKYRIDELYYITKKNKYRITQLFNILENDIIYEDEYRCKIIKSVIYQLLISILYMYINYGLVHNNINKNAIFIEKTDKKYIIIEVKNTKYKIKLFGFIIKISGFEKSMSWDLLNLNDYREKIYYECKNSLNPCYDINAIKELFSDIFDNLDTQIINMMELNNINKYYTQTTKIYCEEDIHKKNTKSLKDKYFEYINKAIYFDKDIINMTEMENSSLSLSSNI